jgi:hypothetical protein
MPKKPEIVELDLDEALFDSRKQATSMSLPLAIHYRLDVLADLAKRSGASRAEIIGMLISDADLDASELTQRIMVYRDKSVGEVVPVDSPESAEEREHANVVRFEKRTPGRPRRKAG